LCVYIASILAAVVKVAPPPIENPATPVGKSQSIKSAISEVFAHSSDLI
jgi:hypothetical protein